MDGINPTLAFAVLFLGLSGNAREAPEESAVTITLDEAACPSLTVADDPAQTPAIETWAEALWDSDDTSSLDELIEPKWSDSAPLEMKTWETTGGADPMAQQIVPTSLTGLSPDLDVAPCAPER